MVDKAINFLKYAKKPAPIEFDQSERDLVLRCLVTFERVTSVCLMHMTAENNHTQPERDNLNLDGITSVRRKFERWLRHPSQEDGRYYAYPFGADWLILLNALVLCGGGNLTLRNKLLARFW